jgi:hypothetical protein
MRTHLLPCLAAAAALALAPAPVPSADDLPPSVDLRPLLDGWGLGPRLQGNRNTCSAFVVTGALEFALARIEGRGVRLSPEYLNWASNRATGDAEDGGFFSDLWKGFLAHGICPEADMPYRSEFRADAAPSAEAAERARSALRPGLRLRWIKEWDPKRGLAADELLEVRRTLARGSPVCGGFLWPRRQRWDEDVLRIVPRDAVRDGHSVLLVGYRDDPARPGGGLFIIRNSANRGRDGLLTYEYLLKYMNDAAWIEVPGAEPAPPPAGRRRRI